MGEIDGLLFSDRLVGVYFMRMARVNVYLPDDLAASARSAGVNVSAVTQEALRAVIAGTETDRWVAGLPQDPPSELDHELILAALEHAREELGA